MGKMQESMGEDLWPMPSTRADQMTRMVPSAPYKAGGHCHFLIKKWQTHKGQGSNLEECWTPRVQQQSKSSTQHALTLIGAGAQTQLQILGVSQGLEISDAAIKVHGLKRMRGRLDVSRGARVN